MANHSHVHLSHARYSSAGRREGYSLVASRPAIKAAARGLGPRNVYQTSLPFVGGAAGHETTCVKGSG